MDKNKVKIELYKSKAMAKFSHYSDGKLFYIIELEEGTFQFPIETTEDYIEYGLPENEGEDEIETEAMRLSSSLGDTAFGIEMRASELNRWIAIAIDGKKFMKISE